MAESTIGPGRDHATLAAWEGLHQANLTGAGPELAHCYPYDDTTTCLIDGWTTTAADYIGVHMDATARHAGIWDGDKWNLVATNDKALGIYEEYVRIDGGQLMIGSQTADSKWVIYVTGGATSDVWLSNLIIRGSGDATYNTIGILVNVSIVVKIWNAIIYGIQTHDTDCLAAKFAGAVSIYSSVLIGGRVALGVYAGTCVAKNVYCGGSFSEDFYKNAGTLDKHNCASEDLSADDTTTGETQDSCITGVAIDTDTFVNVSAGTEDFHLAADGLSPLQGTGEDTSGDAAPLNFATDIDGQTRDATWDIGADAWYVAGGGYTIVIDPGSYALSGQAAGVLAGRKIAAEAGVYALSGQDIAALFGRKLAADAGVYTVTGSDVTLIYTPGGGAYVLTCEGGAYAITGADAGLLRDAKIAADGGAYIVTGQDAATLIGRLLDAGAGAYALTVQDAALLRAARLAIEAGAYAVTGADATLIYTPGGGAYILTCEGGVYAIAGADVGLLRDARIAADGEAYVVTGQDAATLLGRLLDAGAGTYAVTGTDAALLRAARIAIEAGTYAVTWADAAVRRETGRLPLEAPLTDWTVPKEWRWAAGMVLGGAMLGLDYLGPNIPLPREPSLGPTAPLPREPSLIW